MDDLDAVTGFQRDLLFVLNGHDEPKGLTVQREVADYYGTDVSPARVYQNLDSLAEDGLVEKGTQDSRTNYYRITEPGQELLDAQRAWKREYTESLEMDTV
jgi:PadR family transcriptional regulator PadR